MRAARHNESYAPKLNIIGKALFGDLWQDIPVPAQPDDLTDNGASQRFSDAPFNASGPAPAPAEPQKPADSPSFPQTPQPALPDIPNAPPAASST
jgi:hypothetical protein